MDPMQRGMLDLPEGLLELVFGLLPTADWKRLQLTCKTFRPVVAALSLQEVSFTLSTDGVKGLAKIFQEEKQASVQRLRHVPIPAWPKCSDLFHFKLRFHDFDRSGIRAHPIRKDDTEAMQAYEEAAKRKDEKNRESFKEYQAEYKHAQTRIRNLASDLYFLEERHGDGDSPLQQFDKMVSSLVNLRDFVQEPWSQRLNRTWRHLYLEGCSDEDQDAEALHLCLVLRSFGLANLPSLRYMKFAVRGPAFWTPTRLGWLLRNGDLGHLRMIRARTDGSVSEIEAGMATKEEERDDSGVVAQEKSKFASELNIIFNSVRHVSYLDCNISEDDLQESLLSIAAPLSEFLSRARDLRRLRLAFGLLTDGRTGPSDQGADGQVKLLTLLKEIKPWPNLQRIKLAMVIEEQALLDFLYSIRLTVTRVTLQRVTLVSGKGTWKSTLAEIAKMFPSVCLKLHLLYEYTQFPRFNKPIQRALFPEAAVWKRGDVSYSQDPQLVDRRTKFL